MGTTVTVYWVSGSSLSSTILVVLSDTSCCGEREQSVGVGLVNGNTVVLRFVWTACLKKSQEWTLKVSDFTLRLRQSCPCAFRAGMPERENRADLKEMNQISSDETQGGC